MEAVATETAGLERSISESYRERRSSREPGWVAAIRRDGMERFRETGFPTVREDAWKYTNVAPFVKVPFQLASGERGAFARPLPLPAGAGVQIVLVNGRYAPELSSVGLLTGGLEVTSLAEVIAARPEAVEPYLAKTIRDGNAFAQLNSAFLEDGVFVRIPARTALPEPIHLVFLSEPTFGPTVSHPRNLVIAEAGSEAAVVATWKAASPSRSSFEKSSTAPSPTTTSVTALVK